MKSVRKMMLAILNDESGQSTTEYVLLLVFVVMAVKAVGGKLQTGLNTLIQTAFDRANTEVGNGQ